MGKRSAGKFARNPKDFYVTPREAVLPLLPHLAKRTFFTEPCAGNGALIDHLELFGHACYGAWDIEPHRDDICQGDARDPEYTTRDASDVFITNPPWSRPILHELIVALSDVKPTWLLFDADWVHTKQAIPYMVRLQKIVSVGRVKWIADSPYVGKDNCAWHLFDCPSSSWPCYFIGRQS